MPQVGGNNDEAGAVFTRDATGTRTVLANLEPASIQHLNAFVQNLDALGFKFEPQVFTPDEYAPVIGMDQGSKRGPGRGNRGRR